MTRKRLFHLLIVLLGLGLLLDLASRLGAEILWFQEVRYLPAFLLRLQVRLILMSVVTGFTALYLLGNLALARHLKHPHPEAIDEVPKAIPHYRYVRARSTSRSTALQPPPAASTTPIAKLRLRSLLPLTIALSLLAALLLLYYGQLAVQYWQTGPILPATFVSRFSTRYLLQTGPQLVGQIGLLLGVLGVAVALLVYPRLLGTIAIVFSIVLGWLISKQWAVALQYLNPTAFNATDPLFGQDIGFYIFSLPFWELLELWLFGLFLYGFIAVLLTYLVSGDSLSQGAFPGFSSNQHRHLYGVGGALMLAIALSYWLSRFELLYSPRGVAFGASYTDVTAQLPIYRVLSILALAIALYLLGRTVFWQPSSPRRHWVALGLGLFGLGVIVGVIAPEAVQYLVVQPNELVRERPFIERTIALTRQAFGLEAINSVNFDPQGQLTEADLAANNLTIRNIRLWDQRPLLQTNRQLQQIRPYYRFPDADIDRYTLQLDAPTQPAEASTEEPPPPPAAAPTEQRQVLIAARELDYSAVPQEAQTWVNRHLIYTHGFGFTLSPVNTVGAGGLPEYFVKDITGGVEGALTTASPAIRASIPIGMPRIYYGEIANTYVMTQTLTRELDFPSGSDNAYNVYSGQGGINMGSWWRRVLFSAYLRDWRILFTRDFLPETKVLFRRNIKHRIQAIAPFLRFDSDPYLVTADAQPGDTSQTFLYWIVDAYTTSDRYPYSDPGSEGISYIRNSVKAVVDAYHGSVDFYVADPTDPMIATWSKAFPGMFKPLSTMPASLQSHLRYPVDFFNLQSDRLMTYHMTDPQVFYNREDQWQIPNEVYGDEARPVEPYYLITSLPGVPFEEFILLLPYTPRQRTNLIAWLAARSDGENYGKLLLYTFPKERLVFGPEQIEARINQDPVISQQISLWNRQGSRAIQGNLLIIPIEQSLLYVEPLYLEATQNSLPTLVRVIVAYENRIVMAPTLEESLQAIFSPEVTPGETIIRPVEEPGTGT